MRPTIPEQLRGVREVLARVVAPQVDDPYAADVLGGALDVLDLVADAWTEAVPFLRWDAAATADVLRLAGEPVPAAPEDPADVTALERHHREVRARLEAAMPAVLAHDGARAAAVQLFRDRADRYPLNARPRGGFAAHPAR